MPSKGEVGRLERLSDGGGGSGGLGDLNRPPQRRSTFQYSDFLNPQQISELRDGEATMTTTMGSPSLRGRLNEGTLHRYSLQEESMVEVDRPVGKLVERIRQQGTWAQQFSDADQLREAVTTGTDSVTGLEEALEREINELRADPKQFSVYVEEDAVLAEPYVLGDDAYFEDGETTSMDVSWYGVPVANYEETEPREMATPQDANKGKSASNEEPRESVTSDHSNRTSSRNRPLSKATNRSQSGRTADETTTGRINAQVILPDLSALLSQSTIKERSIRGLRLSELRAHAAAQQRCCTVVDHTLQVLRENWREACLLQKQVWASADEKSSKKKKTSRKGAQGRNSPTLQAEGSLLEEQRRVAREKLNHTYQEHMTVLYLMRRKLVDTCRRAIAGANVILETVRALRQVQPCKELRHSRGLKIAARDTVGEFHEVVPPQQSHLVQATKLSFLSDRSPSETAAAPSTVNHDPNSSKMERKAEKSEPVSGGAEGTHSDDDDDNNDGDGDGAEEYNAGSRLLHDLEAMEESDQRLPATCYLREELEALSLIGRRACERYGFVSREVRGIQLYWVAEEAGLTPRTVVIHMLMGVAVPEFILGSHGFPSPTAAAASSTKETTDETLAEDSPCEPNMFTLMDQIQRDLQGEMDEEENGEEREKEKGSTNWCNYLHSFYWKGRPHPTSRAAEAHLAEKIGKATTSLQKRSAEAARRLGSLLWSDATQVGCSWQPVQEHRAVPQYYHEGAQVGKEGGGEEATTNAGKIARSPNTIVAATVFLGCGYETIESVIQRENLSVGETRRLILSDRGEDAWNNDNTNHTNSAHHVGVRKAVVDLHSRLGVRLLQPQTHPIWVSDPLMKPVMTIALRTNVLKGENTEMVSTTIHSTSSHRHRRRTDVGAALTAAEPPEPIPVAPVLSRELLLQRSLVDSCVFLVLINVQAIYQTFQGKPVLVHLYEKQIGAEEEDDGEDDDVERDYSDHSPYEHIGFIRLQFLPQSSGTAVRTVNTLRQAATTTAPSSTDTFTSTVTHGVTPIIDYTTGLKLSDIQPALTKSEGAASSSSSSSPLPTIGWPLTTNYFTEREGVILSPLSLVLWGNGETMRFQVRFAPRSRLSSFHESILSTRRILRKLRIQEEEDVTKNEEMRRHREEQREEKKKRAEERLREEAEKSSTEAGSEVSKATSAHPKSITGKAGKKNTHHEENQSTMTSGTTALHTPAQWRELFSLPPLEIFDFMDTHLFDTEERVERVLEEISGEGSRDLQSIDPRRFYSLPEEDHGKAAQVLKSDAKKAKKRLEEEVKPTAEKEEARLEKELAKRKGKDQVKVRAELEEVQEGLNRAVEESRQLSLLATKVSEEFSRRSKDRVLRQSRIRDLEKQLAQQEAREVEELSAMEKREATEGENTSKVQLWFHSPQSVGDNPFRGETQANSPNLMSFESVFASEEGVVFEREVRIPKGFQGRAVLLVDGQETVTWNVVSP